jgi:hypothetical protein
MVLGYIKPSGTADFFVYIRKIAIYVKDLLAILAYEMVMLVAVMIVPGGTIKVAYVQQFAGICHLAEVPVNRRFAYRRVLPYHKIIYMLGCSMCVQFLDRVYNQLALDGASFILNYSG